MKRKPPSAHSIGIDLDEQAIKEFECPYPVELIHGDAHRFLCSYDYRGSELVYCDPPYLKSTRRSNRCYRYDYTEQNHVELLRLLKELPCRVMLSGYPSVLYDETLAKWNSVELQVLIHGSVRTEKVWFNFQADRVHWASYAGRNFTDRQRIKRKAASWGRRYQELPQAERVAVMAAMLAVEVNEATQADP